MATVKISALSAAGPLTGAEVLPIVQTSTTYRTTTQEIADLATSAVGVISAAVTAVSNAISNEISVRASAVNAVSNSLSALSDKVVSISAQLTSLEVHASAASAAATSADGHANTVSAAVEVVSAALANEISVRASAVNAVSDKVSVLSDRITSVSAALTSLEVHASTASAAATSADGHANTASAAATSVDARVNVISNSLSAVSALSVGVAANGLQSAVNALSNTISNEASARAASIQTLSDAVTSIGSRVTSVLSVDISALRSGASVRTSTGGATSAHGYQSVLDALSNQISDTVTSLRQTSADLETHVVAASAAATSVDSRVNSVNVFISGISSRSVGDVSTHGFQSVVDALSSRISAVTGNSVTSAEVQTASAAATSVNNRVTSVLSTDISALRSGASVRTSTGGATSVHGYQSVLDALSNQVSDTVTSLRQTSADLETHVVAASAAATSVDSRVNSVNTFISGISTRSVGDVSTHGLQSAVDALSNRISAGGGTGSVTSAEVQAVSDAVTSIGSRVTSVLSTDISALRSGISVRTSTGGATSAKGFQSVIDALSNQVSDVLTSVRQTSADLETHIVAASAAATSVDARVTSVLSTDISALRSGISVRTSTGGTTSAHGFQSVVDALSNQVSDVLTSVRQTSADLETHILAVSDAVTSVDARVNTLSNTLSAVSALSVGVAANGLQSAINALSNTISATSAAVTSVDAHVNTVSNQVSVNKSALVNASTTGSLAAISLMQSAINTVSNADSVTRSALTNASTTGSLAAISLMQSAINTVSDKVSVLSGEQDKGYISVVQSISATTLTNLSGLSVSVSAGGIYQLDGLLLIDRVSTDQPVRLGMTFSAMTNIRGWIAAGHSAVRMFEGDSASGSVILSTTSVGGASTTAVIGAVLEASVNGTIQLQAATSASAAITSFNRGSYIRVYKIAP